MKRKWSAFLCRSLAALRKFLASAAGGIPAPARGLGEEALALGQQTLALARRHQTALTRLVLPSTSPATRSRLTRRAEAGGQRFHPFEQQVRA